MLTISNIGTDTLRIQNVISSSDVFSVRPTIRTLGVGQSFVDTIRFAPTVIGVETSSIIISSNSSTGSDTINVAGFGYGQGVASIATPAIVSGTVKLGQYKDTTIVVKNTGNDNDDYAPEWELFAWYSSCSKPVSRGFGRYEHTGSSRM